MERARAYHRMVAFIDWNSRLLAYKEVKDGSLINFSSYVLKKSASAISKRLSQLFPEDRFSIDLRFYHGWHKGFTPTANRKAMESAIQATDFSALSTNANVVYSGVAEYGDRLLAAHPSRLHQGLSIHLPNTLRSQSRRKPDVEKMVDTAMAADILTTAFQDPDSWVLVMAEDDDLVPPLFAAEVFLASRHSRALLLRSTKASCLKLNGIICEAQ